MPLPAARAGDAELLAAITMVCDEFEAYGWRRGMPHLWSFDSRMEIITAQPYFLKLCRL
jgi:hypothetical protein